MGKQYLLSGRQCGWDNQATLPIEQPCQDFHLEGWVMLCNMLYNRGGVISHIMLYNMLYGGVT